MSGLAVTIDARRLRALVVGDGPAAAKAAAEVAAADGMVRVVGGTPGPELQKLAGRDTRVELALREYAPDDVAWATLVFAASDDPLLNSRVVEHAHLAGRLVSDEAGGDTATFVRPETLRIGDVLIAVSTPGVDPLARRIRDQLADQIDGSYGRAMEGLLSLRAELLARGADERWRDAQESLLDDDVCQSIERGSFPRRLAAWR